MKASAPWMSLASLSLSARWVELIGFCSRLDQLGTVMLHRSVFWPISLVLICDHSHKRGLLSAVSNFWLHIKSLFLPPVSLSISFTLPLWVSYKDELRKGLCFWTARPSLLLYVISVKAFRVSTTQLSISWRAAFRGRHVKLQDEWARESKRKNERRPIKAKRKGEKKKKQRRKTDAPYCEQTNIFVDTLYGSHGEWSGNWPVSWQCQCYMLSHTLSFTVEPNRLFCDQSPDSLFSATE